MESARIVFDAKPDEKGALHPVNAGVVRSRLARWAGRHVTVSVSRYVKSKTLPQLGYYFGTVVPVWAEYAGYEQDEMHRELKKAYLPRVRSVSRLTGEEVEELPSLADLNAEQMSAYLDRVLREAALQGLYIPKPHEGAL